jgi:hypothetical protein
VAAVPIKPEYGPTLGRLLSPRWRAASPLTRGVVRALVLAAIALAIAVFLTLENAHYSRGGRVPFSFSYRGMSRVAPAAGEWVRLERRGAHGVLEDSFSVRPLLLPRYAGSLSGELPLYAAGYIRALRRHDSGFVLRGEGKTRVNAVPAYNVEYTTRVSGRTMFGRDVLLVAQRPGEREGVNIVMLTSPTANAQVTSPLEVASEGVLLKPLKTFTLG